MKQRIKEASADAKNRMIHSSIEVYATAALGAALAFGSAYHHQVQRSSYTSAAFSEIEQLEDAALANGAPVNPDPAHQGNAQPHGTLNPLEQYYTELYDATGKIFEARNMEIRYPRGASQRREHFARKFDEAHSSRYRRYRHTLAELMQSLPISARGALVELTGVQVVQTNAQIAAPVFDRSWSYGYSDDTHESCTTYTDSEGNSQESCVTVCDRRHHRWTWHGEEGSRAHSLLARAAAQQQRLAYHEMSEPATVRAFNREAIVKSMRRKEPDVPITEEAILERALKYKTGSAYEQNIHSLIPLWDQVRQGDLAAWQSAVRTAKSDRKTTSYCGPTDGPAEYELAKDITTRIRRVERLSGDIVEPIRLVQTAIGQHELLGKQFYVAQTGFQHHFPDVDASGMNPTRLEREFFSSTVRMYEANFPGGNPVHDFSWGFVLGMTVLGTMLGFGAGVAADKAVDKLWGSQRSFNPYRFR